MRSRLTSLASRPQLAKVEVPASQQDGAAPGREAQFRVSRYSRYAQSGYSRHHDHRRIAVRVALGDALSTPVVTPVGLI